MTTNSPRVQICMVQRLNYAHSYTAFTTTLLKRIILRTVIAFLNGNMHSWITDQFEVSGTQTIKQNPRGTACMQ